jgi:hypothetical protein
MNRDNTKKTLTAIGAVLVIAASLTWIFVSQCGPPRYETTLHQAVGQVLAEETTALAGNHGEVIVLVVERGKFPLLKAQLKGLLDTLKAMPGIKTKIVEYKADKPKYGLGSGLSAHHLVKECKKYPKAIAIISLIGVPELTAEDLDQLRDKVPKFIVETRSAKKLRPSLEKQVVQLAVVPRFRFPAPVRTPKTPREWFDKHFQIVTNAAALPATE